MSRSRGGGGRGRGGRVLQAQLTRSSLTLLSRFPSSAAPPFPRVPLGESLSLSLSLSFSLPLALLFPLARPSRLALFFFLSPLLSSELLLFSSGVSVSSRSPSRLLLPPAPLPPSAPGASPQRQHSSSSILRSARILTLVSCCLHFAVTFLTLFFAYGWRTREKEKKREK